MPLQRVVEPDALTDEALAVIDEQPQVKLWPIQVRDGERVGPFAQRGARDVERVDVIRLAALAGALTRLGHQVGRHAQHALATLDQKPLKGPRHVPAVLQRPDALAFEATRPPQQRSEPAPADLNGVIAKQLAGRRRDRGDRVRPLVRVRAEHDH